MEETFVCHRCGGEFPVAQHTEFYGADLCWNCLRATTTVCVHCGTLFRTEDNQGTDEEPICPTCRKRYYGLCVKCGSLVFLNGEYTMYDEDDTERVRPWCEDCFWTHYEQLHPEEMDEWIKQRPLPGQTTLVWWR